MREKKDKDEEENCIIAEHLDAKINVNKRVQMCKKLAINIYSNSFNSMYMGYLYYHWCYILLDSPGNKQVDIHEVGKVENGNYLTEERRLYCVFYCNSCTQFFNNDIYTI